MERTIVEVERKDINLASFLMMLKEKYDYIKDNNVLVVASQKYVKQLLKSFYCAKSEDEITKVINAIYRNPIADYHYCIRFETKKCNPDNLYRLISMETNDNEYKNLYKEPDFKTDIGVLLLTRKGEKELTITKR